MPVKGKTEIEIAGGMKVQAQTPVIVSASRSTDIPAFYSDWFIKRLEAGYVNLNNAAALENWNRHLVCPHAGTITGR